MTPISVDQIGAGEWAEVARRVVPFVDEDVGSRLCHVRLVALQGRRRWVGTDGYRLAVLDVDGGGAVVDSFAVSVPARLVVAALEMSGGGPVGLSIVCDDEGVPQQVHAVLDGLRARYLAGPDDFPETGPIVEGALADAAATVTVDRDALLAMARAASAGDDRPEEESEVPARLRLTVGGGQVGLELEEPGVDPGFFTIDVPTEGSGSVLLNTAWLIELIDAALAGPVQVSLPASLGACLMLVSGAWTGCLMPVDDTPERYRSNVEALLHEGFGLDEISRDDDGDYCFPFEGGVLYVRLPSDKPARVQVFSILLDQSELTHELLVEINDQNTHVGFLRVFWCDGQVLAEIELVAEGLDRPALGHACRLVADVTARIGPPLRAVFGGPPTQSGLAGPSESPGSR